MTNLLSTLPRHAHIFFGFPEDPGVLEVILNPTSADPVVLARYRFARPVVLARGGAA